MLGRLGGWQYPVRASEPHNSYFNFLVFRAPRSYGRTPLGQEDRNNLKKAAVLSYRRITDLEELAGQGHRVLAEFFARNDYTFRRDRLRPQVFRRWAAGLLAEPKVFVLGAYRETRLCAVHVSFRVQNVLLFDVSFSSRAGRAACSDYGVLDFLRRKAAQTGVSFISVGPVSHKASLDDFKRRRGAEVLTLPARLSCNPLARGLLRLAAPGSHQRLLGVPPTVPRPAL
ncbi:MAG: hypothetical protein V2A77_05780 [Pseudomonadota bacterium]